MQTIPELAIESGIEVPPYKRVIVSPLTEKIRVLASKGKVGDSITEFASTKAGSSYIGSLASKLGLKVIVRKVFPIVHHPSKKTYCLYRIWRSDGLSVEELNKTIRR